RAFPAEVARLANNKVPSASQGVMGDEHEGLKFLRSRALESEMWTLLNTALLSEAKLLLQEGSGLATVMEKIVQAHHVGVVKGTTQSIGPGCLMQATLYARSGQTHQAIACCEQFLLHAVEDGNVTKSASLEDVLKAIHKQAALLATAGHLNAAQTLFDKVPASILRVLKFQTQHQIQQEILHARQMLRQKRLKHARISIESLLKQFSHCDLDKQFFIKLLEVELVMRKGSLQQVIPLLDNLAIKLDIELNNDVMLKCKLLVLKAQVWARSGHAFKGFSLTMRAIEVAYKSRTLPALFDAIIALTHILNGAYEFEASKHVLTAIVPGVLECADCELTARTYAMLASCHAGQAGLASGHQSDDAIMQKRKSGGNIANNKQKELMSVAVEYLEKAIDQWKFIEDVDGQLNALSKKAKIFAWRGDVKLADEVAEQYIELHKQYTAEAV
ncbi:APC5 protein, partial [Elasticomyces elasticus]